MTACCVRRRWAFRQIPKADKGKEKEGGLSAPLALSGLTPRGYLANETGQGQGRIMPRNS